MCEPYGKSRKNSQQDQAKPELFEHFLHLLLLSISLRTMKVVVTLTEHMAVVNVSASQPQQTSQREIIYMRIYSDEENILFC